MAMAVVNWSGDEWQQHVLLLLKRRYAPGQFQEIPDKDRGDCGLEGFANDGCAFQCYAAEEPLSVADLSEKQKTKITRDIKKFCDNNDILPKLLGLIKIKHWILLVPRFASKEVVEHAEKKAAEVRDKKLPYVAKDFCVRVTNGDEFAVERQQIFEAKLSCVKVQAGDVLPAEISSWEAGNSEIVRVLDGKLARMKPGLTVTNRAGYRADLVKHYVAGQNVLAKLHADYAELFEAVLKCKKQQENFLRVELLANTDPPARVLKNTLTSYQRMLTENVAGIDANTAQLLAWEAIADWLLRCPLDFEEAV